MNYVREIARSRRMDNHSSATHRSNAHGHSWFAAVVWRLPTVSHWSLVVAATMGVRILAMTATAEAQSHSDAIDLVVQPGRPLRVALDERVTVRRVGQLPCTLISWGGT